jgi:hypothetical protein
MKYNVVYHFTFDSKVYDPGDVIDEGTINDAGLEFLRGRGNIVAAKETEVKVETPAAKEAPKAEQKVEVEAPAEKVEEKTEPEVKKEESKHKSFKSKYNNK